MIHVYSLQVNALQDLNALSDVGREILSSYGHEDPLEHGKQWGLIQNEHVKRRKATRPPPPAAAPAAPKPSAPTQEPPQKESDQETTSKPPPQQKNEGKPEKPAPQRKKGDLFSSFAKTKPKTKTESAAGAESVSASQANPYCFRLSLLTCYLGQKR
jgi:DNA polymerase delta subunit 3